MAQMWHGPDWIEVGVRGFDGARWKAFSTRISIRSRTRRDRRRVESYMPTAHLAHLADALNALGAVLITCQPGYLKPLHIARARSRTMRWARVQGSVSSAALDRLC